MLMGQTDRQTDGRQTSTLRFLLDVANVTKRSLSFENQLMYQGGMKLNGRFCLVEASALTHISVLSYLRI